MARHGFLGVPIKTFEEGGRRHLIAMLNQGLNPESKFLDIGCGCLRLAYWIMRFLDPDCYFGIEPAKQRVEYGLQCLFTPEEVRSKRPRFDYNPDFDFSVFDTRFDYFLATSIWTHASKRQIAASLDSYCHTATPMGIFMTSYFPAETPEEDYQGDVWVGTSHESSTPGVIKHSLAWIQAQCQQRGLLVQELPGRDCDWQLWLRISRA